MWHFYGQRTISRAIRRGCKYAKGCGDGASVITITGRNEICIENYRGILEYTDLLIRVQTKSGQIRLSGKNLQIEYYTNDEMKITGRIVQLEFTDGRKTG